MDSYHRRRLIAVTHCLDASKVIVEQLLLSTDALEHEIAATRTAVDDSLHVLKRANARIPRAEQ